MGTCCPPPPVTTVGAEMRCRREDYVCRCRIRTVAIGIVKPGFWGIEAGARSAMLVSLFCLFAFLLAAPRWNSCFTWAWYASSPLPRGCGTRRYFTLSILCALCVPKGLFIVGNQSRYLSLSIVASAQVTDMIRRDTVSCSVYAATSITYPLTRPPT